MFRIFFTNHGFFAQSEFTSMDEAISWGKSKCMDFTVHSGGSMVASWTVFGGTRYHG